MSVYSSFKSFILFRILNLHFLRIAWLFPHLMSIYQVLYIVYVMFFSCVNVFIYESNRVYNISLQRRRDRYIVIYMWKILENLVPNLTPKVQIYTSERRGRLCYTQHVPIGHIGTLCFNSFRWKASRLFNSLPDNIRNTTNFENSVFKKKVILIYELY